MQKRIVVTGVMGAMLLAAIPGFSQRLVTEKARMKGHVVVPASSMEQAGEEGEFAHTNFQLFVPVEPFSTAKPQAAGLPPFSGYLYETPASIACVYNLVSGSVTGCNPNLTTKVVTGGSKAIAIVDAYDDPTAAADLALFSTQFGLPLPGNNFQVVYAAGVQPAVDPTGGWEVEESLDIEWAHAMAPNAKIFLVEAASNSTKDLLLGVQMASNLVAAAGGGEVSMSWGGSETKKEATNDVYFMMPGVVYFASIGDSPGTIWPGVSPFVISAGGTTLSRDLISGSLMGENIWQVTGGGPSSYEPRPFFQDYLASTIGPSRGTPDVSFDSNPATGVWVYDGNPLPDATAVGWYVVGGTSVAAPSLAGITNLAGTFSMSSVAENVLIYGHPAGFKDITYGNCGPYASDFASAGWDFCSGVGSVNGLTGK